MGIGRELLVSDRFLVLFQEVLEKVKELATEGKDKQVTVR